MQIKRQIRSVELICIFFWDKLQLNNRSSVYKDSNHFYEANHDLNHQKWQFDHSLPCGSEEDIMTRSAGKKRSLSTLTMSPTTTSFHAFFSQCPWGLSTSTIELFTCSSKFKDLNMSHESIFPKPNIHIIYSVQWCRFLSRTSWYTVIFSKYPPERIERENCLMDCYNLIIQGDLLQVME